MFPGQFMVARRTQVPSSARPLRDGCNNPKRAKATLFRELPHLFWPISSSFCKDLGWAVMAEGKRPLKKESKSYFRKSCSQRAGRGRCLCMMGVPLHSLTNLKHSTDRMAYVPNRAGNPVTLPVGRGFRAWKKRPTLQLSKINCRARQSSIWATVQLRPRQGLLQTAYPPPCRWKQGQRDSEIMSTDQQFSKDPFPKTEARSSFSIRSEECVEQLLSAEWPWEESGLSVLQGYGYAEFLGTITVGVGQGYLPLRTQTTSL